MFGSFGLGEFLLLVGILLLIFGPAKLPEIGRNLGRAIGEFRKESRKEKEEENRVKENKNK